MRELRQYATRVLSRVKQGETVGITDRGVLVAQINPVATDPWGSLIQSGALLPAADPAPLTDLVPLTDGPPSLSEALVEQREHER